MPNHAKTPKAMSDIVMRRFLRTTGATLAVMMPVMGLSRAAVGEMNAGSNVSLFLGFLLYGAVFLFSANPRSLSTSKKLLLGTVTAQLLSFYYIAGGLLAPIIGTMPLLPILATFLFGRGAGWIMTAFSVIVLLLFSAATYGDWPLPEVAVSGNAVAYAKALMLALTCLVVMLVVWAYATQNSLLQQALYNAATEDVLTAIPNRRAFDSALEREMSRWSRDQGTPLSLLLIDIDRFKQLNDLLGHQAGDRCLRAVAQICSDCISRNTDLVARYGGDEFAILLPATSLTEASKLAEECRAAVADARISHPDNVRPHVTLSIGAATSIPTPVEDFTEATKLCSASLLSDADAALYKAKHNGRDRVESAN